MKLNTVTFALIISLIFTSFVYEAEAGTIRRTKTQKTPRNTKTPKDPTASTLAKKGKGKTCKKVKSYKALNGCRLDGIIESLFKSQDFSSYCRSNFMDARAWFLDLVNHPAYKAPSDDDYNNYMKERLILALTYSANCKDGCTLPTENDWLSSTDHCKWTGITCNTSKEITGLRLIVYRNEGYGLSGDFTMFGMKSLETVVLGNNNLSGAFIVAGASPNLTRLNLEGNKFTGFVGGKELTNLENLELDDNDFKGDFIVNEENFPTSIKLLNLANNGLKGFVGGGILKNLESLVLGNNEFVGNFIVNEENFPDSIIDLDLDGNRLTGFVGGKILTNLEYLGLGENVFADDFIISEENFPKSIKNLNLYRNKVTDFIGGKILTNLELLSFQENAFEDDLIIKKDNFPYSLKNLNLEENGLTSVDAEFDAVLELNELQLRGNVGISVTTELCDRTGLQVYPVSLCLGVP